MIDLHCFPNRYSYQNNINIKEKIFSNRARKSRRTLQNKVRINVAPVQLTLFVNLFCHSKNALNNNLLL